MNVDPNHNKRRFHRIFYNATATLSAGTTSWSCQIIDISLNGCLLRFADSCPENTQQLFVLTLQLSDTVIITMELSVSHVIDNTIGFACEHIDIDSISELKRLVELNLGDYKLLERDLMALAELH